MSSNKDYSDRFLDESVDWTISDSLKYPTSTYHGYESLEEELSKVSELKKAWLEAKKWTQNHSAKTLAKVAYTLDKPIFYKMCNDLLRQWYQTEDKQKFPLKNFVRMLEMQCEKLEKEVTLYRGINLGCDNKIQAEYDSGKYYIKTNQFLSCSIDKQVGMSFASKVGTLYVIKTKFAIKILNTSKFPYEKEFIIPPGVYLRIMNIRAESSYNVVDLQMVEAAVVAAVDKHLVLDTVHGKVTLQKYDSSAETQRWFIQNRYIRSMVNGHALDVDHPFSKGAYVITWPLHCKKNQEWFWNDDQSIESGKKTLVLDIDIKVQGGAYIIVWTKHGKSNQKFELMKLN